METVVAYASTANASNDVQSAGEAAYVSMANAKTRGAKNAVVDFGDPRTLSPNRASKIQRPFFFATRKSQPGQNNATPIQNAPWRAGGVKPLPRGV